MTDVDIVDSDLSVHARMFFHDHPHIVDGLERWERALAGKKRDQRSMRIVLEAAAVQAIMLLVELRQAEQ